MKTKLHVNELVCLDETSWRYNRVPNEFAMHIDNLCNLTPVAFSTIERGRIEAIGTLQHEKFPAMNWNIFFNQKEDTSGIFLNLYLTPFVASQQVYKPINPSKEGQYSRTTIGTKRELHILREDCIKTMKPSLIEQLQSKKTTREIIPQYGFRDLVGEFELIIKPNTQIIPIYSDNTDYQRIMEYVDSQKSK